VKATFTIVSIVIRIPTGRPIAKPEGMTIHGRSIEDVAPEAYTARTLFGEMEFKLDLSIFSPRTGTTLSKLDAKGRLSFVIDDRPKK
jgi:hypothetical protein